MPVVPPQAELTGYAGFPDSDCRNGAVIGAPDGHALIDRLLSHHSIRSTGHDLPGLRLMGHVFGLEVEGSGLAAGDPRRPGGADSGRKPTAFRIRRASSVWRRLRQVYRNSRNRRRGAQVDIDAGSGCGSGGGPVRSTLPAPADQRQPDQVAEKDEALAQAGVGVAGVALGEGVVDVGDSAPVAPGGDLHQHLVAVRS